MHNEWTRLTRQTKNVLSNLLQGLMCKSAAIDKEMLACDIEEIALSFLHYNMRILRLRLTFASCVHMRLCVCER